MAMMCAILCYIACPDSKVHGAHLGPTGPRWAPCWPHELCYLGGVITAPDCSNLNLCWVYMGPDVISAKSWLKWWCPISKTDLHISLYLGKMNLWMFSYTNIARRFFQWEWFVFDCWKRWLVAIMRVIYPLWPRNAERVVWYTLIYNDISLFCYHMSIMVFQITGNSTVSLASCSD